MSTIIMSACWALQGMSGPQKSVLISLADNANDEGFCWPSVAKISKRTCLSERAVQNSIKWLCTAGILSLQERMGRSTVYTITPASYAPPQEMHPAGDAPQPPHAVHPTPAPRAPRTVIEPSLEPIKSPSASETPGDDETIPHEKIRELYNQVLGGKLARCLGLTEKHRRKIRACHNLKLEGKFVVREGGLSFWEGLFNDVLDCPFLLGTNNRAWAADFEFLTTATNIQKFMEGKYDAR